MATWICHAQAQINTQDTSTLYRAAYCVGVLKSAIRNVETSSKTTAAIGCRYSPELRAALGISVADDFDVCVKEEAAAQLRTVQDKWKRYREYVAIQMMTLPQDLKTRLSLIMARASAITVAKATTSTPS
jgi:hypothetical protein